MVILNTLLPPLPPPPPTIFSPLTFLSFYSRRISPPLPPPHHLYLASFTLLLLLYFPLIFITLFYPLLFFSSLSHPLVVYFIIAVWKNPDAGRKFFENYATEHGFDPLVAENWYSSSIKHIQDVKVNFYYFWESVSLVVFRLFENSFSFARVVSRVSFVAGISRIVFAAFSIFVVCFRFQFVSPLGSSLPRAYVQF